MYKNIPVIIALVCITFTQPGCSSSSKSSDSSEESQENYNSYKKDKDGVYFQDQKVESADVRTFKILNEFYGKDAKNVYFMGRIHKSDVATIVPVDIAYAKDKKNVYGWNGKPVRGVDPKKFQMIGKTYGKDAKYVYNILAGIEKVEGANPKTFQDIKHTYGKDNRKVYYNGREIEGADLETFEVLKNFGDAKDKNHKYAMGDIVE